MGVERLGPTPEFIDYVAKRYVILDKNQIKVDSREKILEQIKAIKQIEIPNFQREIVWGKDEVLTLIESRSPVYGSVILAKYSEPNHILLDGLQRFATGTSLLHQLYPLVLSDMPQDSLAAKNYKGLKAGHRYQDLIELDDLLLKNHPRDIIAESYFKLEEEIAKILKEKIQDLEFAQNIEKMFLEKLVAIDEYSGFADRGEMMQTFVTLNNTGIDLTETDLLRDAFLDQAEKCKWDAGDKDDFENVFSNIFFSGTNLPHLKKLGKYLYETIIKNPTFVFPNWESFSKDNFDNFAKYLRNFKDAKNNPSGFPYLSEIFQCGGLPFTFAVLHFWHSHYLKGEIPDFAEGGEYVTTDECRTLLRACYRSLIVGNIGRIGPTITHFTQQENYGFDKAVNGINPASLLGSLSDSPDEEFVVNQLFSITRTEHYKRVYNACMLPEKTNNSTDFHPLSFGSKVNDWALDHLIPKSMLQKEPAIGAADGRKLGNLAPLLNRLNTRVKALDCSFKLKPEEAYDQVKNDHPYIEWLVNTHYNVDPEISALSQDKWQDCFDRQENLTIDAKIPIGKERIRCIAKLLLNRI